MNRSSRHLIPLFLLATTLAHGQEPAKVPQEIRGVIRQVTLYRDRALVTREIAVEPGDQVRRVVVPDLPQLVVPDSVVADGDEGTSVRAVQVALGSTLRTPDEDILALNKQIEGMEQQQAESQQVLDVVNKNMESLDQMVAFSVEAGKTDLSHGVLDAESLTKLTTFSMTQRRELADQEFQLLTKLQAVTDAITAYESKRDVLAGRRSVRNHQATIFVETAGGGAGVVRLSYLVRGCTWLPQYTVRGSIGKSSFQLRYSALVQQTSGEDWNNVRLVLSTASPSVSAARPVLTPLRIVSVEPSGTRHGSQTNTTADPFGEPITTPSFGAPAADDLAEMLQSLRVQQRQAEAELDTQQMADASDARDLTLNSLAGKMQQIELQAESKSWRTLAPDIDDDVASQVYSLAQSVSLDMRHEQQLVQILEAQLDGEMYHVAAPLLSTYAYREARLTNTQPIGLLGGPASIYLDERFVGRTDIPSTASGQHITIGFGADQQVRTRRELLDKRDEVQGGNRRLTFVYRLVLANFKDQPVVVRLMDRMPNTRQAQQLSVRLDTPKQPLSADGLYQRIEQPTGILRWDLTVPAGRHGSDAYDVQYSYTVEFDRNRVPTTQHMLSEMQADYRMRIQGGGMGGMGGFGGGMGGGTQ